MGGIGRLWVMLAGLGGAVAVGAGAYANHALAGAEHEQARAWMTLASQYQLWHALALVAAAVLAERAAGVARLVVRLSGWLFLAGSLLFCGTLYALALGIALPMGNTAPAGGSSMIAGWALLALGALVPGWTAKRR
ncbi:uncharacterized membrane protein YgdD (TMEM256/DUF423 family) [Azospirillum fermentarium]|uniref:DUF423 domain-containing protein n=1 Tax=Azospirillum fermentarium TaxID=1233114 RepID=UPI00222608FE|nr:DUF423 domain-containing protein [Azospirillum fermentarium]MCW2246615.1 uncharacterized membrane protein YgdD (TMEM256/DUF423 family) [Azospirillum fermentarium]